MAPLALRSGPYLAHVIVFAVLSLGVAGWVAGPWALSALATACWACILERVTFPHGTRVARLDPDRATFERYTTMLWQRRGFTVTSSLKHFAAQAPLAPSCRRVSGHFATGPRPFLHAAREDILLRILLREGSRGLGREHWRQVVSPGHPSYVPSSEGGPQVHTAVDVSRVPGVGTWGRLCTRCMTLLLFSHFTDGHAWCRRCKAVDDRDRTDTAVGFLKRLLSSARTRAILRLKPCTLTEADVHQLVDAQGGRCAKTGVPLVLRPLHHFKASLDEIAPGGGYVPGNVQLVIHEANTRGFGGAQVTREHWDAVFASVARVAPAATRVDADHPTVRKLALNARMQDGVGALRGRWALGGTVTREQLAAKLEAQAMRCWYSGLPLTQTPGPFQASCERLDCALAHTDANTVVICAMLNCVECGGVGGMSRRKLLEMFLARGPGASSAAARARVQAELAALPE